MSLREELRLGPDALRRRCDPAELGFTTTAEVTPADGAFGQARALRSIDFAVEVPSSATTSSPPGQMAPGSSIPSRRACGCTRSADPAPRDVVFLFNFQEPAKPLCASLEPGRGRRLRAGHERLVEQAGREIPQAFESESYQHRRSAIVEPLEHEREALLAEVRTFARSRGLDLEVTPAAWCGSRSSTGGR